MLDNKEIRLARARYRLERALTEAVVRFEEETGRMVKALTTDAFGLDGKPAHLIDDQVGTEKVWVHLRTDEEEERPRNRAADRVAGKVDEAEAIPVRF